MKNLTQIIAVVFLAFFTFENATAQCGATSVTADTQPFMICEGDAVLVTFTPAGTCAGNYEYEVLIGATVVQAWSTTATFNAAPITTTDYTVNLRCSSCPATVVSEIFTVEVIEEPTVVGNLTVCPSDNTTLTASGSTGNLSWWNQAQGGVQLSPNDIYNTPGLLGTTTFYVSASGSTGSGTGSILITECGLDGANGGSGSEDYIEISNLYTTPMNTTGWTVAVSSSYSNINSSNATTWSLPNSFPACSVVTRTDYSSSPDYWGNNIFWNSTSNSWAIIIDDVGNVVDFLAWGWTAAQLATFNPTINGFSINLGAEWVGNGAPLPCGSAGGVQYSFARIGAADTHTAADWTCQPTSVNVVNPGLSCGWTVGLSCPYPVTVTVSPSLDATITPVGPFCASDAPLDLTAVDPGGTWSGTGITDPNLGTFDPAQAVAGANTITYTIPGSCGDVQTYDIVINPPFDATITQAGPFCTSDPALTLASVDPGGVWSGNGITNPATGDFDPATAGVGTHTITYTIGGACGDVHTIDIDVFLVWDATITPSGPHCESDASLMLSAVDVGGTWSGNGIINTATGEFDPGAAGGGTHTITYNIPGACGDVQTIDILVYDQLDATITQVGPFCEYDAAIVLSSVDAGGVWSGTGITNSATGAFDPGIAGAGLHTVTYDIAQVCGDLQTVDIQVYATPIINFTADNVAACAPLDVTFTNSSAPGGTDCEWNFGNDLTSNSCGSATTQYNTPGCYDVTLTVTEDGCTSTETIPSMICVIEDPVAQFLALSTESNIFDPEFEFTNTSLNANTYEWNFGDGATSNASDEVTHLYPDVPAGYTVCLTAINSMYEGCADSICVPVVINDLVIYYLPNTFTPDGDNFNEYFQPVFTSGYDPYDFDMFIFNRWGEVIWESHDATVGWDGTYGVSGKLVQDGTYNWKIEFKTSANDERVSVSGSVSLIR